MREKTLEKGAATVPRLRFASPHCRSATNARSQISGMYRQDLEMYTPMGRQCLHPTIDDVQIKLANLYPDGRA